MRPSRPPSGFRRRIWLCPLRSARHEMPSSRRTRHRSVRHGPYSCGRPETAMPAPLLLIETTETLPPAADVVVIGGGIVGASAAFFLAERGLSVALVEKGYVSGEQSSRNWGWCRQQNRDERELPLSGVALRLWGEFESKIGEDVGFRRCGLLYATDNPQQLAEWESWRDTARQFNVNTKMLSAGEAAAAIPANGRRWLGGVHSINDGKGEPSIAAPMIA